ncbi:MAG: 2-oxoacid:acceptor oxidoreductase subunit alpha [Candidatus Eisenbacteria bacterium]|nr:2-oxoacid:acceptor oxidoreductase subunit alpha [Candidatus Eisenbacteria bacterium]
MKPKLIQGNEACVEGAVRAGLTFFAGYPITPSSEIAEYVSGVLPRLGGKFIQMEDEIASASAIIGASIAGAKAMTATSGPGFSLMQETIGYAGMAEIPCVFIDVQRGGPSTGLPTLPSQGDFMQVMWGSHGDHPIAAVAPWSAAETVELMVTAFNISEEFRMPTVVLLDEVIGHVREGVDLSLFDNLHVVERMKPKEKPEDYIPFRRRPGEITPLANFGEGYRYHITGLTHDERGFSTLKPNEIDANIRALVSKMDMVSKKYASSYSFLMDDADFVVFAYGCSARVAKRAVTLARQKGIKAGLLRPRLVWPFPEHELRNLGSHVREILVPELNMGQAVREVERAVAGKTKVTRLSKVDGELFDPEEILEAITKG